MYRLITLFIIYNYLIIYYLLIHKNRKKVQLKPMSKHPLQTLYKFFYTTKKKISFLFKSENSHKKCTFIYCTKTQMIYKLIHSVETVNFSTS